MPKSYYEAICQRFFGPFSSVARNQSADRNFRFLVCDKPRRSGGGFDIPILGAGDSYRAALVAALRSHAGAHAIAEQRKAIEVAKAAVEAKTPEEFADWVTEQAVEEAKLVGATQEQIEAVREKFNKAKEKIVNDDNREGSAGKQAV